MKAIEVRDLSKAFHGFHALRSVSLAVEPGERRAIIGPNGAGKTTLFNLIGGQARPTGGRIVMAGEDVTGAPPHRMRRNGLARTFQRNELFLGLTVMANARLAVLRALGLGPHLFSDVTADGRVEDAIAAALDRVGLAARADTLVRDLAYGEQRQLELALALTGEPKILLLDEPTAGMSPGETQAIIAMLARLPRAITLLIVEHDMDVVFALADRITVLNLGEVLAEGGPQEIQKDARVVSLYLGQYAGAA